MVSFKKDLLDGLTPQTSRYDVTDQKTPGLRLTVFPSGVKTYYLLKRVKDRPLRIKIGRHPQITIEQARNKAKLFNSKIMLGENPHDEKIAERQEINFGELYDNYYYQHAIPHTKCAEENKLVLEYHFLPQFKKEKVILISSDMLKDLHKEIGADSGEVIANRVLNLVSAVFNFGIKNNKFRGENPCRKVKRFKRVSRDRFLSREELNAFLEALEEEDQLYQDYFMLLLLTGVRKTNQLSMNWDEIDLDLKRWRIPESKAKNGDINIVYLHDQAIEILERRKREMEKSDVQSPFVFPGTGKKGHFADPKKAFGRIKNRMGVSNIRIHDLRRTLGSYMAISGASLPVIGQALNHKSHVSTAVYARLSQDPVKYAINKAVNLMLGNNVISLFRENTALFTSIYQRGSIKFSELLAA